MNFPERDILYLNDMLIYAREAVGFAAETTFEALRHDLKTRLALERAVEIVGEAAKSVTDETKALLPNLPWREMARTRDFFAHHYFKIDLEIVWRICTVELPVVIHALEDALT